jgi:hypothetical protein
MQIIANQDMHLSLVNTFTNPSLVVSKSIYQSFCSLGANPWQSSWAILALPQRLEDSYSSLSSPCRTTGARALLSISSMKELVPARPFCGVKAIKLPGVTRYQPDASRISEPFVTFHQGEVVIIIVWHSRSFHSSIRLAFF